MAPSDFQQTVGKQRAVWIGPGGKLVVGGELVDIGAILTESGTAILEPYLWLEETLKNWDLEIPILRVPPGAIVLKAVAMCGLSAIDWEESDNVIWAIDEVHTELKVASQEFFVVAHLGNLGYERTTIQRVSYHVTIYLGGRDIFHRPEVLRELERA